MLEYQAYGYQKKAGEESVKGMRFVQMPINYLRSTLSKGELAIKWLHNIGMSHTVETFNFNRKMVCQDHVTIDMEHRLPGLGERRLLNEAILSTLNLCTERKVRGRSEGSVLHAKKGLAKGTNLMYANTIYGVLEYHSMYFLYYNKNQ